MPVLTEFCPVVIKNGKESYMHPDKDPDFQHAVDGGIQSLIMYIKAIILFFVWSKSKSSTKKESQPGSAR